MPDWTEFDECVATGSNKSRLAELFITKRNNNWCNFCFINTQCGNVYFLQFNCTHNSLFLYFETTGRNENFQETICQNLRELIKENQNDKNWNFHLEEWNNDRKIKREIIPNDSQKQGNLQWIIDTMILIANNLSAMEKDASALLDNNKQKNAEKTENKTKKGNLQNIHKEKKTQWEFEFGMFTINNHWTIPVPGVTESQFDTFSNLQLTGHDQKEKAIPHFASWAVWEPNKSKTTKNTDLGIGELFKSKKTESLNKLRPNIIFVGENISQPVDAEWRNFHEDKDPGNAFLRYAIQDSCFEGAYLTDIIKGYINPNGNEVQAVVANDHELHKKNFDKELQELAKLTQEKSPMIIILLGNDAKSLFIKYYGTTFNECANNIGALLQRNVLICERYHYSARISYSEYQTQFWNLQEEIKKYVKFETRTSD